MIYMDVDTALPEVPVNSVPLIDDTDFKTLETGVAYNASGMALNWHFVTKDGNYTVTAVTPTTGGDYDWAHQGQGMYSIAIPASAGASINNDTEGHGWFTGFVTGVLPFRGPTITLRPASINNALVIGSTYLGANVLQFGSSNGSFASGRPAVNTTHFNGVAATASGGQPYVQVPRLFGLAPVTGTIGVTGNDTTHLHLDGLTYADDELNGLMLVILDSDASRYYVTWIRDWVNATALATVDALPFTPQDSTDTYTILVIPEAGGGTAQTGDAYAYLTSNLGANGANATEAGGTGDHLTAVAQASAYTATRAGYLDNINNAALQTTAAQTGDSYARLGAPSGASVSADVATAQADLDIITGTDGVTLASSQPNYAPALVGAEMTLANGAIQTSKITDGAFTAAKFGSGAFDAVWSVATRTLTSASGLGIATAAKLLAYVQLLMRSDAAIATDNAAELTEINADGGSGAGDYANTADANEAISDAAAAVKAKTDQLAFGAANRVNAQVYGMEADTLTASALAADAVVEINAASNPLVLQSTTIATLASQLSFTLTAGSADDDAYNGCLAIVTDASTSTQKAKGVVLQYVGSSRTVRLAFDPGVFTMAAGDSIVIMAANETPIIHAEMSVKSTAGSTAQLTAWMEVSGMRVPVATIDAAATCGFVVREHQSGTNLFTKAGVAANITNSMFEVEQTSPAFTDDRQYELTATITLNGVAYSTTHSRVVIG